MDTDKKEEQKFEESFEVFMFERLEQIGAEYRATEGCRKLLSEEKKLYSSIKKLLPGKSARLLAGYTDIFYISMSEQHHYYYRCGLQDSVRLIRYILEGRR